MIIPNLDQYPVKHDKLIGRVYIKFKEISLAFDAPSEYFISGGPVPFSSLGANEDRAVRGLQLFNYWINNIDIKDLNNRNYLLKDFDSENSQSYFEGQKDLGASMGGLFTQGGIDRLHTGKLFVTKRKINGVTKLYFRESVIFSPKAWNHTTYSDALWMAKKIANLDYNDYKEVAESTLWPSYMKQMLVYKLIERRNNIAEIFRLPLMDNPILNYIVSLRNDKDIEIAANEFGVSASLIKDELIRVNLLNTNYEDVLVYNGKLTKCYQSIMNSILVKEKYPVGLVKRIGRVHDNLEQNKVCRYGENHGSSTIVQSVKGILNKKKSIKAIENE